MEKIILSSLLIVLLFGGSAVVGARISGGSADAIRLPSDREAASPVSGKLCELCEEYAAVALAYMSKNGTEDEVLQKLHGACAKFSLLRQQCVTLVDYYIPLLFLEIDTIDPEQFCKKVHLCKEGQRTVVARRSRDPCSLCRFAAVEVLMKLRDPDTQLEVVELLIELCNQLKNIDHGQCKNVVKTYVPLTVFNVEEYLETTDVCSSVLPCEPVA